MNCKEFQKKLSLYSAGELSEFQSDKAAEHLKTCENCTLLHEAELKLIQDLSILQTEEDDSLHQKSINEVMNTIREMPLPGVVPRETSVVWRITYTLYNAFALGVMFSALFIIYFSGLISFDQVAFLPEARDALFGGFLILVGGVFVILQGKELTVWFATRLKQLTTFQLAPDSIVMFAAGLCMWITGSILLFNALF